MTGSAIWRNEGHGIRAYCEECFAPRFFEDVAFNGQIAGYGNTIPGPDEEDGNGQGDICPEEYLFLKDPAPEE